MSHFMRKYLYLVVNNKRTGVFVKLFQLVLLPLSYIYKGIVYLLRWMYTVGILKENRIPRPVISIGNITIGGVGKTPIIQLIAEYIKKQSLAPAILMRGYQSKKIRDSGQAIVRNDEAIMLENSLKGIPVLVGQNRVKKAQEYLNNNSIDVFLLDDGFQHWKMYRNLNIVAIDATNPFGNRHLIPRGILREPFRSLARADMIVITKTDIGQSNVSMIRSLVKTIKNDMPIVETIHQPVCFQELYHQDCKDLTFLQNKRICCFCSIGHPDSFLQTLETLKINIHKNFWFLDHHWYEEKDVAEIAQYAIENEINFLVTTLKDAVKLKDYKHLWGDLKVLILKIKIQIIRGEHEFYNRISRIL